MFTVEIVTPEKMLVSEQATMVVLPGAEGELGLLEKHAPLVSLLCPGVVTIHAASNTSEYFVTGGFVSMANDHCNILADEAISRGSLTLEMAKERLHHAQEALSAADTEAEEEEARQEQTIAEAMLAIIQRV